MHVTHCYVCNRPSGFARRLGFGTFFMVLLTFGLWLLVIPFYPIRCTTCGCSRGDAGPAPGAPSQRGVIGGLTTWEIIALVLAVGVILTGLFHTLIGPSSSNNRASAPTESVSSPVRTSAATEDPSIRLHYAGGAPVSDGRTYSVALIDANASRLPVNTPFFVQGTVFALSSGDSSGGSIVLRDEGTHAQLGCHLNADVYKAAKRDFPVGHPVKVFGKYWGTVTDDPVVNGTLIFAIAP